VQLFCLIKVEDSTSNDCEKEPRKREVERADVRGKER
jgi:hypothetical protein